MKNYFSNSERKQQLVEASLQWLDTPFANHASVRGAGVDCVHLVAAILQENGALKTFDWPKYALDSGVHSKKSALLAWLDACRELQRTEIARAGDVICFNLGLSEHHIGLMLDDQKFIHVLPRRRVIVSALVESYYSRRITAIFRPMEK